MLWSDLDKETIELLHFMETMRVTDGIPYEYFEKFPHFKLAKEKQREMLLKCTSKELFINAVQDQHCLREIKAMRRGISNLYIRNGRRRIDIRVTIDKEGADYTVFRKEETHPKEIHFSISMSESERTRGLMMLEGIGFRGREANSQRFMLHTPDEYAGANAILKTLFKIFHAFKTHVHLDFGGKHGPAALCQVLEIDEFYMVKRITIYRPLTNLYCWQEIIYQFRNVKEIVLGPTCNTNDLVMNYVETKRSCNIRKAPRWLSKEQLEEFYEKNLFLDR